MRFLQTEWHRHERDRNAWEIEKQEMKSRIANLEGQARRADATQKALKKYVTILEKKVKDQSALLKDGTAASADAESDKAKFDRAALLQEKLRCEFLFPSFYVGSIARAALTCPAKSQHRWKSLPPPRQWVSMGPWRVLPRTRMRATSSRPSSTNAKPSSPT